MSSATTVPTSSGMQASSVFSFGTVETPVGTLLVLATGAGVVRVAYESEDQTAVLAGVSAALGLPIAESAGGIDDVAMELTEYFAGTRREFTVRLDRSLSSGFYRQAQEEVSQIPYGQTASYSEIAASAGNPRAVRAVGSACATNPLPILVPCHRVLRSDGKIGGYLGDAPGGVSMKQQLLELERGN